MAPFSRFGVKTEKLNAEKCRERKIFLQSIFLPINRAEGDLVESDVGPLHTARFSVPQKAVTGGQEARRNAISTAGGTWSDWCRMVPFSRFGVKTEKLIAEKCRARKIFLQSIFLPINRAEGDLVESDVDPLHTA
jgi:hypothetical protein